MYRTALLMGCVLVVIGCGSENGGQDGSNNGGGTSESGVVLCYGNACPYGACDETSGQQNSCAAYDGPYNVTNRASVCDPSNDGSYCVAISTRDDGQYAFGEMQLWFVTCAGNSTNVDICMRNGCEASLGCN